MAVETTGSYKAFREKRVIENLPGNQRVESLCCWDGYLLAGLQDGTVAQFSGTPGDNGTWQLVRGHRSLERKAVVQMAAVQLGARAMLLALTEDGVNLLTLPDMKLKFQPTNSRGASLFAWSEADQLLAVAVRRRILLYQLHGSDLLDAGERTAPDVVAAMLWVGPRVLLLGLKRQYMLLNIGTGATTDLGPTGTAPHPLALLVPGGQELLLARDTCTYYHSAADGRASRRTHLDWSEPLLALAAAGQQAVAVTASGLEVRSLRRVAEAHVVQRLQLAEPQRPVTPAVAADGSVFVVAAAAAAAAAPAAAPAAGGAAAPGSAAAGAGSAILRLQPVSLEEQARTLAEMGEYGEALNLAEMVDEEEEEEEAKKAQAKARAREGPGAQSGFGAAAACSRPSGGGGSSSSNGGGGGAAAAAAGPGAGAGARRSGRRALLEERLRLAYGHYLFQAGEYDEGMAQLALCKSVTALVLLRLFPSLVPAKFKPCLPTHAAGQPLPTVSEPTGEAYVTAVSQLLPYILSRRTRAIIALSEEAAAAAAAAEEARVEDGEAAAEGEAKRRAGAVGATGERGAAVTRPAETAAAGVDKAAASGAVAVVAVRPPGSRPPASSEDAEAGADAGAAGAAAASPSDEIALSFPPPPPPRELLVILDTAIVRIMVVMPDTGALLRFMQLDNYVDLQEGAKALEESGMYAELAALYKAHGCHEQGLELLRKLSQEPAALPRPARGAAADLPGLPGVWAAVRYLVSLTAADAAVIQRHAGWILAADVEAGLSALLHMRPPLDPSLALSILNRHSDHYCGLYLETALQIGVALPQDYHNELLLIYLRDILAKEPRSPGRAANHSGADLKELLLAHRPDPDQPPILFPEDLAHALLNIPHHHHGAAAAARRFASAPASSVGTPAAGLSRAGSRSSMLSGGTGAGGGAAAAARGKAATAAASTESSSESSESESDSAEEAWAGGGGGSGRAASSLEAEGATTAAAARRASQNGTAPAVPRARALPAGRRRSGAEAVQRPRRPRRTSAGALGSATGKPPPAPAHAASAADATTAGAVAAAHPPAADGGAAAATAAAAKAAAGPSLYQRLRDLVYTSPYIDPSYVLDKLPLGELLEIRALMLERLGNHREALRLYLHALHDLAGAEAYCDRVYAAAVGADSGGGSGAAAGRRRRALDALDAGVLGDPARPGDIYLELVRALYDGPESCPSATAVAAAGGGGGAGPPATGWLVPAAAPSGDGGQGHGLDRETWQALSKLLSRKRERLDPLQVLALLPDDVVVADVLPWLEGALRFTLEARRNLAVLRQLRRSENLTAQEEAARARQRRVVVTAERACCLCTKRLGTAAFMMYPGADMLAHYSCHMKHTGGAGRAEAPDGGGAPGAGGVRGGARAGGGEGAVGVVEVAPHHAHPRHHHQHQQQYPQHQQQQAGAGTRGPSGSAGGGAEVAAWV